MPRNDWQVYLVCGAVFVGTMSGCGQRAVPSRPVNPVASNVPAATEYVTASPKIAAALQASGHLSFHESRLADVVVFLQKQVGLEVRVHYQAIRDAGRESNPAVTRDIGGDVSLQAGLRLLLRGFRLAHVVQGDVLLITTEEEARQLVEAGQAFDPTTLPLPRKDRVAVKLRDALQSSTRFAFIGTPLVDIARFLKDQHSVEIQLDDRSLIEAGLKPDLPVTIEVVNQPLEVALRELVQRAGVGLTIEDEMILITAPTQEPVGAAKAQSELMAIAAAIAAGRRA